MNITEQIKDLRKKYGLNRRARALARFALHNDSLGTGKELSKMLGVEKSSIYTYVRALNNMGFRINNKENGGPYMVHDRPSGELVEWFFSDIEPGVGRNQGFELDVPSSLHVQPKSETKKQEPKQEPKPEPKPNNAQQSKLEQFKQKTEKVEIETTPATRPIKIPPPSQRTQSRVVEIHRDGQWVLLPEWYFDDIREKAMRWDMMEKTLTEAAQSINDVLGQIK